MPLAPVRVPRLSICGFFLAAAGFSVAHAQPGVGDEGTAIIPGTPWHVHDGARPQPPTVAPGAAFSELAAPPADATVLFDGKDLSQWEAADGGVLSARIVDGAIEVIPANGHHHFRTKQVYPDFQLHLEFASPVKINGKGQYRGNSGVLINGMYEIQILDSYDNPTYPDGQAGAIYGQTPPLVNASRPPGQWQTYDIIFESPLWDQAGLLTKKAAVTVIQNGVVVQNHREIFGSTDGINGIPHKSLGVYHTPHPPEVFIELQEHKNPVRFRNIWIRALGIYDKGAK
jgi:hypothetical protein